jgi:hypothetical protein
MKTKSTKKPVGCRLEEEYRNALAAEADERGVEVSDVIRHYIIKGLREEAAQATLFEQLASILSQLKESRRDHSLMTEVLLHSAGRFDPTKARQWAEKIIRAE